MQSQTSIAKPGDDYLYINRFVMAALLKCDPEGLDDERALARIAELLDEVEDFKPENVQVAQIRAGSHGRAKASPDGDTVTVEMLKPFTHGREEITELVFKAPRFADVRAMADAKTGGRGVAVLFSRCCGRTENELAGLHFADFMTCQAAIAFLQEGR